MSRRQPLIFLAPALLVLAAVSAYPLMYVFALSMERRMIIFDIREFVGLENYASLLNDPRFYTALWNTLYFTAVSVALEILLGTALALLLFRTRRFSGLLRTIVLIPWAIPTVVSAKMWEWLFNADHGVINQLLGLSINWLGSPRLALHAAIAVDVWKTTPFVAILLLAALQGLPQDLLDAAALDGAAPRWIFLRIILPLISPVLLVAVLFRALDALRVFDSIYVLTGGGPAGSTETLSLYAYRLLFQTLEFGYGSAAAVVVFLIAGGCAVAYQRAARRTEW